MLTIFFPYQSVVFMRYFGSS